MRGQPLLALGLVLTAWVGARALAWERALKHEAGSQLAMQAQGPAGAALLPRAAQAGRPMLPDAASGAAPRQLHPVVTPEWALVAAPRPVMAPGAAPMPRLLPGLAPLEPSRVSPLPPPVPLSRVAGAAGHQSMWLAATALLPLPPLGLRPAPSAAPGEPGRRWSGDAWLLLRGESSRITPGPRVGTYGSSQVGAVIRYRLDRTSPNRPSVYLRAASALRTRDQEVALGLSARPLAGLPIVAMAEARAVRDGGGIRVKPAIALVTELPPQPLPLGFTGEVYVQGGWIGGRRPGGFIDGLARAERPVMEPVEGFRLKAGAGAWAAKQRGASRVDIGPVASLTMGLGGTASARLEADWRFRVGGRSKPDSGPALTLSAGF